jgi:hypothetical protein
MLAEAQAWLAQVASATPPGAPEPPSLADPADAALDAVTCAPLLMAWGLAAAQQVPGLVG